MSKETAQLVDKYLEDHPKYASILARLRVIMKQSGLDETIKWGKPTYTLSNKNIAAICAFKNGGGIWFFQGALLTDHLKVLTNAQEGKTHAMRRWLFKVDQIINESDVMTYVDEAIQNELAGKRISPKRGPVKVVIPHELAEALNEHTDLLSSFDLLSPSKQKEYCEYIETAKRLQTKKTRLLKILPMILSGSGLNDKYK